MVGAQGAAWNAGRILASGLLVSLTGYLHDSMQLTWAMAWSVIMVLVALIMLSAALWHRKVLPTGDIVSHSGTAPGAMLIESLVDFFKKPKMLGMFLAVVLYRSGEGFLEKVSPLFMMDGRDVGGLGLSNQDLGHLNGTIGTLAFLISTMLGGIWVAKHGLKKTYFWFCLALNIPNFSYVFLATTLPDNFYVVATAVIVEKFGYGFGTAGYMLYMMQQVAPGRYRTSHYAFATGLMALSVMLPGYYSGAIQVALGYKNFFWFVIFATIPSFIVTWFAPFPHDEKDASSLKR